MNETTIAFIRHGKVHNPDNILYGRLHGFDLNDEGREQAQIAAKWLQREMPPKHIFTSPMQRAIHTAEIIGKFLGVHQIKTSQLLNEVHTPYEGITLAKVREMNGDIYSGIDSIYEQPEDLVNRIQIFIRETLWKYAGENILAITHGDIIAYLILWNKGASLSPINNQMLSEFNISDNYPQHASITLLRFKTTKSDEIPDLKYVRPY